MGDRQFLVQQFVPLLKPVPALRVSNNHRSAPEVAQHVRADLPGESTACFSCTVLTAQENVRMTEGSSHGEEVGKRRIDRRIDGAFGACGHQRRQQRIGQLRAGSKVGIHLPIAADKGSA